MKIKVKICGIANVRDAELALSLGADELGFILAPSPRRVEPEAVKAILEGLRGGSRLKAFRAVGVFVNERADAMRDIIAFAGLDAAQVHGDEGPAECAPFDFPWYRALRISCVADAMSLAGAGWACPRLLVDSGDGGAYGGTGQSLGTWPAIAARALAREAGKEFFVAGGVRPRNVASVIHSIRPDGVDVSSGVEDSPGRKSPEKLEALFRAIGDAVSDRERDAYRESGRAREAERAAR